MFHYYAMLCVYYECAIAFAIEERHIKKYVEPVLHGFPILSGLLVSFYFLFHDLYNPQMGNFLPHASWCTPSGYPMSCGKEIECIRGFDTSTVLLITTGAMSSYFLIIIVTSLSLVLRKVILTERMLHGNIKQILLQINDFAEKHKNTKVALLQTFLYVVGFLVCISPPFLRVIADRYHASETVLITLLLSTMFLLPLMGFFNFLIFMTHKVYNYRRVNKAVTIGHVLWLFFSRLHMNRALYLGYPFSGMMKIPLMMNMWRRKMFLKW
jgi:hypothetical protein